VKKALIVSPYLDHLGGGERYMLSAASAFEELGYEIYFAWDNLQEISSLAAMLGIKLKKPQLDPQIKNLYLNHHPFSMFLATRPYDLVFYLSDGSIPILGGKHNLLHMQVPFHGVGGRSWKNALKNKLIHGVVVNSNFTKRIVDREYDIDSMVVYPPVQTMEVGTKKKKIILSVGRFEPSLNTKNQDVLIEAFKKLSPKLPGWKLVLAGASNSEAWITHLKKIATGFPIEFVINVSHPELKKLYQQTSIYWHAAGYGVDERKNPEFTEHFGISTVEAISAGCTPLVVPYGGQREIVKDSVFHWTSPEELIEKTLHFSSTTPQSSFDITSYSVEHFRQTLKSLL
jgi:glycosyltransferase involved in cell wall biosynthesis